MAHIFLLRSTYNNKRLSLFHVADGDLARYVGVGLFDDGNKDVSISATGEMFACDNKSGHIYVFSADGSTLLRSWGSTGSLDGQFQSPTALAVVNFKLFVLDMGGTRVQMFE